MKTNAIHLTFKRTDGAEVEATIGPDGNVTLTVRRAPAMTCRVLTATLEAELGDITARKYDPRALAAAGMTEEQVDRTIVKAGAGGSPCG
jgi:hypothetical protein